MDRNWVEIKKNLGIIEKALKNKNKYLLIFKVNSYKQLLPFGQ